MKKAGIGDTVRVYYTGKLDDGAVFDSSRGHEPLEFTIGKGRLIKGFEDAVVGMSVGESKTVKIPSDEAYGHYRNQLVLGIPREQFPPTIEPREGLVLNLRQPDGSIIDVVIAGISPEAVTLDANHPLAGKNLTFDIDLVEIV